MEKAFFGEQSAQDSNLQFVRDMLTQRAPDKAAVLKTYRRIHAGKAVPDEERSPVKTHLKLSGVVKRKEGKLTVRNRIYERVFNQEWIGQNTPRDWARRIAVISTILAVVLGGLFGYYTYRQGQQTTEARAQAFIDSFRGTTSADVRITSLAGLFELPGYQDRARQLFYEELSPEEQRVLFEKADIQAVGTQLITVVKGLYMELENDDQSNQLLEAMAQPLRELDDAMAVNLATEIEQLVTGRRAYDAGKYQQAVDAYSVAISLNDRNPGTYFDRGLAYAAMGEPHQTLDDFETAVLSMDESLRVQVRQAVVSDGQLYAALWSKREAYKALAALVPTPTGTPTSTAIPTPVLSTDTPAPTPTWTPTPIPTWTPTPTPTATRKVMTTPTKAVTQAISCSFKPSDTFHKIWQAEQSRLGCALDEVKVWTAEELFQRGFMFWREDTRQIYVLAAGGTWQVFHDTWTEDQPLYSCPDVAPSQSPPTPLRGFGKVWCERLGGPNAAIGWATQQEEGFADDRWVDCQHGTMLRSGQWGELWGIFVLYGDGTWQLKK